MAETPKTCQQFSENAEGIFFKEPVKGELLTKMHVRQGDAQCAHPFVLHRGSATLPDSQTMQPTQTQSTQDTI